MTGGRPPGFPRLPPEGSPSLRRQKPDARNQTFGRILHFFGFKIRFLVKFLDDSAWFCVEESKKHSFSVKIYIFDKKTDLDPKNPEKSGKKSFNKAPLRGP